MDAIEFQGFPKIARLSRECVITEKIDGTNAQIFIGPNPIIPDYTDFLVGSRTRWLTKEADNHGFYAWCMENREELLKLGPGRHFGEWWGSKIQRGYGLVNGEKRFSLFNTGRWNSENVPECCSVVPVLFQGIFTTEEVNCAVARLHIGGSVAAPGFFNPEGVVIFHTASGQLFKKTLDKDESPKGQQL